jgi:hypothetical protein
MEVYLMQLKIFGRVPNEYRYGRVTRNWGYNSRLGGNELRAV